MVWGPVMGLTDSLSHGEGEQAATVASVVPSSSRAVACPAETGKPEPRDGKRPAPPTPTPKMWTTEPDLIWKKVFVDTIRLRR